MIKKLLFGILTLFTLNVFGYEQLLLTEANTVVLDSQVSTSSVAKVQSEIFRKSEALDFDKPIYLVLDTPGGSIFAGNLLIDSIQGGVANPVHTVTIFAASMGYQIAQNLGKRYILPSGVLMSHRAYVGGIKGQLPGEANSMLNFIGDVVTNMEEKAAKRVGIPLKAYQELIRDEYWVYGGDAIKAGHADKVAFVKCSKSLLLEKTKQVRAFGATFELTYNNCPLIRGYTNVRRVRGRMTRDEELKAIKFLDLQFNNKVEFFNKYVKGHELQNK